jgi:hypothetical protein
MLMLLSFLSLLVALKAWRDSKRSPYFFMRRQAAKRLQSYLSMSFVLMLLGAAVGTYGWQAPQDTTLRTALLSNSKPAKADVQELLAQAEAEREAAAAETAAADDDTATTERVSTSLTELLLADSNSANNLPAMLPEEFDQFEPTAELNENTALGEVVFSTEVTDDYTAVSPTRIFAEGFYTLYATFAYEEMADGMEWAWVWRRNGEVIDGGNEIWEYGDDGPGYIYLNPEEGFSEGQYSLEIWVNGELLGQAAATMNNAAVSAGN